MYHFGKPLGCPAIFHQWFTRTTKFGKLALKKRCGIKLKSKKLIKSFFVGKFIFLENSRICGGLFVR
jgi:hypothetical protein